MRIRYFASLLLLLPLLLPAQHSEVGLLVGTSFYRGDLTPSNSPASFKEMHVAFGGFFRYNFGDFVAVRLGLNHGSLSGDDSKSNDADQQARNLSFKTTITEIALTGEFNIMGYQPYNLSRPFSPYIFGGIATTKINPKAQYNGDWIALQPLETEGNSYNLWQFAIPMGIGAKYAINDTWNIGVEAGARMTFTDYIDDVSDVYIDENTLFNNGGELAVALADRSVGDQRFSPGDARGNPNQNDMYFIIGVTISYNFIDNGLSGFRNRFRGSRNGCRTQ